MIRSLGRRILCVVVVILIIAIALLLILADRRLPIFGGARKTRDTHVVVDTLNLTHWRVTKSKGPKNISLDDVIRTIDETSVEIRKKFPDRVIYVTKDRESDLNTPETRIKYADAAKRNGVYVYVVEKYDVDTSERRKSHSARGRDDFMLAVLAGQYKCPVLSEDKFRDFDSFRSDVEPFHVYEFAYWRSIPERSYIRPSSPAYRRLKRPYTLRYENVGLVRPI